MICPDDCQIVLYPCMQMKHAFFSNSNPDIIVNKLNNDLIKISSWLKGNKLTVNINKCEFILLGSAQHLKRWINFVETHPICINDTIIKRVHSCKYLDVIIDKNLDWSDHVAFIHKEMLKSLYLLKRIRNFIDN